MQFTDLALAPSILAAIAEQGYQTPTPIQQQTIPLILQGKDVLGGAQTGTGKTAAFTLPILQKLSTSTTELVAKQVRCLILTPTRELAQQVADNVAAYARHLTQILPKGCKGLLITLDYDQSQMKGPPFSVPHAEVESLLSHAWSLEVVEQQDVLDQEWKFLKGGVTRLVERVYRLDKTANG